MGADGLQLDLEDSIATGEKDKARALLRLHEAIQARADKAELS